MESRSSGTPKVVVPPAPCARGRAQPRGPGARANGQFCAILDHTELRISLSGAKFDEEADFDVRSAVGPPKPHQIDENLIF